MYSHPGSLVPISRCPLPPPLLTENLLWGSGICPLRTLRVQIVSSDLTYEYSRRANAFPVCAAQALSFPSIPGSSLSSQQLSSGMGRAWGCREGGALGGVLRGPWGVWHRCPVSTLHSRGVLTGLHSAFQDRLQGASPHVLVILGVCALVLSSVQSLSCVLLFVTP